jgi:hypothetical protein
MQARPHMRGLRIMLEHTCHDINKFDRSSRCIYKAVSRVGGGHGVAQHARHHSLGVNMLGNMGMEHVSWFMLCEVQIDVSSYGLDSRNITACVVQALRHRV